MWDFNAIVVWCLYCKRSDSSNDAIPFPEGAWNPPAKCRFVSNIMSCSKFSNFNRIFFLEYLQWKLLLGSISEFNEELPTDGSLVKSLVVILGGNIHVVRRN